MNYSFVSEIFLSLAGPGYKALEFFTAEMRFLPIQYLMFKRKLRIKQEVLKERIAR